MAYDNDNQGMLAKNDRKTQDTHPEYSGQITVAGVDYWLSAWVNEGKAGGKMEGRKYFKLSVKPKNPVVSAPATSSAPATKPLVEDDDSSIPF